MTTIRHIPGVKDQKERIARQKLKTINYMLAKTTDPEARKGILQRKIELQLEIFGYEKRKLEIRQYVNKIIEQRKNEEGYEIR